MTRPHYARPPGATILALFGMALAIGGCGLHPLYGGGQSSAAARVLAGVEVAPIGGQDGWLLRNALDDRIAAVRAGAAHYRLVVELDDQITAIGINNLNTATRERRTIRARYRLVDLLQSQTTVVDATAAADSGIDVTSSDYATVAAEQSAMENIVQDLADQIVARIALYGERSKE